MYRLFKTGRSTPINDSDTSPLRKTPKAMIRPPVKAIDYAYESPTRPPRPAFGLYDVAPKLTHARSSSCPLSFPLGGRDMGSSSIPQLLESPLPSTPVKPAVQEVKRRPVALKLRTSNLSSRFAKEEGTQVNCLSAEVRSNLLSHITPATTRSFENVPLPWTLVSTSTLSHGDLHSYLQRPPPSPRVLPPFVLSTCEAESKRLTLELDHLKVKYGKLLSQRDHSLRQVQSGEQAVEVVRTLEKQIARCDRLARQMHVCNDQIRQMETQMSEHQMGIWRLGRDVKRDTLRLTSFPVPPNRYEASSDESEPCDIWDLADSLDTSHTFDSDAILIFPPSQKPVLFDVDFPHTPHFDHRGEAMSQGGTAPLRLVKSRADKCRSLMEVGHDVRKMHRESDWVTPQAMLMSLATAEMWTRP